MRAVVLAAGYATRLYPLTENFPKPLLEIGGVPLIDHLLNTLRDPLECKDIVVVSNRRFEPHFREWCPSDVRLVVNDSTSVEDRLGAVGDLQLGCQSWSDAADCLVVAADNLFDGQLQLIYASYLQSGTTTIGVWRNPSEEDRTRRGNVALDQAGNVERFVEKPSKPFSDLSAIPAYCLKGADLEFVSHYLAGGGNSDAPGHLLEALVKETTVKACLLPQPPQDIGTPESLAQARANWPI